MGVPKFYRWISERYPQINQMISDSSILPEFDNFYLDMNGIIHACTHPNDNQTANSLTLREMILAIFRYIDRMVTEIVKPKKILFMAIDGVAPRAKLNQQRARRFRAAQDREESIAKALERGETVDEEAMFDSNCITPGTEFMEIVGKHLRWFIRKKVKDDPLWRNLKIVFSGHDVPGEGEHKIMQFIRDLRADPTYEPNQRHCMYGQDADLIMLGLASHEPHFALLREVVDFSGGRGKQTVLRQTKDAQFQLLHLSILREYLTLDFALDCSWVPDQERLIDDFIFMTFLVGNDFLPHLPTLDIGEHAFDLLISSYRSLMNASPGYIVLNGDIGDLNRLEQLFVIIGKAENRILSERAAEVKKSNSKRRKYKDNFQPILSEEELQEAEEALQRAYEAAIQVALGKGGDLGDVTLSEYADEDEDEDEGDDCDDEEGSGGEGGKEGEDTKDYRGRYYYEKFKVVSGSDAGRALLGDVMVQYLKGLTWVLAYYIKGCISWTWYYPYHYGPMLQDMVQLDAMVTTFRFELGQPFRPYQQLLGCLPPASTKLLPRPYQWLMVSADSPVKEFYPLEFGIDQDGKKNPWEAVVLLDFIDEVRLLAAEALHCNESKLTSAEKHRNAFGLVMTCVFEPSCIDTYPSCNAEFGLPDIHCCSSTVTESWPSLAPGAYFKPELVPGTSYPIAGFPSLTVLPLVGCRVEAAKINMFGADSKYKSVLVELSSPPITDIDAVNAELLLGRVVYVNYPQVHEARVVGVSTAKEEYRLERVKGAAGALEAVQVTRRVFDDQASQRWRKEAEEEEGKYLKGRGTPGSGGLVVGDIRIRLRVCPLQGLQRDPVTGASKKVYASTSEADVPIQMALWAPPVRDTRFEESDELPVDKLMPYGATVLALTGKLMGVKGRVVGPHTAEQSKDNRFKADGKKSLRRVVDVEFSVPQPEPPFGYSVASSVVEEYFSTKDLCASLQMSPSVLGKLVGSIKVDANRADIGLNLKRNGQYQLLGYANRVEIAEGGADNRRKAWTGSDTVQVVGTVEANPDQANQAAEADGCYWEYSVRAATLIFDYKMRFPRLFANLERLPHQPVYNADQLLEGDGKKGVEEITAWLAAHPFYKIPRTPFSTSSLSRDAMAAIERASDVYHAQNVKKGFTPLVVKGIALADVYCDAYRGPTDISLPYNVLEPRLGDRVVNLTTIGVPFALRGTVVTIHSSTKYVEVIFDEEFVGGRGLQGNCSQFRGRLCPWTGLLLVSRPDEFREFKKQRAGNGKGGASSYSNPRVTPTQSSPVPTKIQSKPVLVESVAVVAPKHSAVKSIALKESLNMAIAATPAAPAVPVPTVPAPLPAAKASKSAALLSALKDRTTEAASNNLLSLLKQHLEVTEEEGKCSLDAQTATVKASNGSGRAALAEAAGFDAASSDLLASLLPSFDRLMAEQQQHPLSGVISYTAAGVAVPPVKSDAAASVLPPTPPPLVKRVVIDKAASQRVVKHQLGVSSTSASAPKPIAVAAAPKQVAAKPSSSSDKSTAAKPDPGTRSITHILQNAKKTAVPAATAVTENAPVVGAVDHKSLSGVAAADTAASGDASNGDASSAPKAKKSVAALLANAKKSLATRHASAADSAPVPAPEETSAVQPASITSILSRVKKHTEIPAPTANAGKSITDLLSSAKKIAPHVVHEASNSSDAQQSASAAAPSAIANLLTNAKRLPVADPASTLSSGAAEASSIGAILQAAKKMPPPQAAAAPAAASSAAPVAVKVAEPAPKKKASSSLVPMKVMLAKTSSASSATSAVAATSAGVAATAEVLVATSEK